MSHSGGLLDIVGCSCSGLAIDDLLSTVSTHTYLDSVHQVALLNSKLILLRKAHCQTQGLSMRNDGHLVERINMLEIVMEESVSSFMISCCSLLFFCHEDTLLSHAKENLVPGFFKVLHINNSLVASCSKESSFVDKVCQVGTACSRSSSGNSCQVYVFCKLYFPCVYSQDIESFLNIRESNCNLTVESTWSEEGWVQYVRSVCCSDDYDARIC